MILPQFGIGSSIQLWFGSVFELVKISYVEITARPDFPTVGRPDLHLFEPTLQTLAKQTMKDFEYIIVDVFWHERKDYFRKHNYGLTIKHVPASPNPWSRLHLVQACHQFNKGVTYASGELILMGADSGMYPPHLMENVWEQYKKDYFVSLGFGLDSTYLSNQTFPHFYKTSISTDWCEFLGFKKDIYMDHRYHQLFNSQQQSFSTITGQWFYGISSISMEAYLKLNGFDLNFDSGNRAYLSDCDLGYRLSMAGYKLGMQKDCYCVEAYAERNWHKKMKQNPRIEIVCNYALLKFNLAKKRFKVNEPLSDSDIDWIITHACGELCEIKSECREKCAYRAPFYNKNEKKLYTYWRKQANRKLNLNAERNDVINNQQDWRGTFVNIQQS